MFSPTPTSSRSSLPLPGLENGGTLNGLFVAGPGFPAVAVLVSGTVRRLEIRDPDRFLMASWDWPDVVALQPPRPPDMTGLCLADRRFPSQQLVITDPTPLPAPVKEPDPVPAAPDPRTVRRIIRRKSRSAPPVSPDRLPGSGRPSGPRRVSTVQKALLACLVIVFLGTLALVPFARDPSRTARLVSLVSTDREARWGDALVGQLEASGVRFCTGPEGTAALDRLAMHLGAFPGAGGRAVLPVHLDVPQVFALPGGRIVVTSAFLEAIESSDDLAAALALALAGGQQRSAVSGVLRRQGIRALAALMAGAYSSESIRLDSALKTGRIGPDEAMVVDRMALALLRGAGYRQRALGVLLLDARKNPAFNQPMDHALLRPWGYTQPVSAERMRALHAAPRGGGDALTWAEWQAVRKVCR